MIRYILLAVAGVIGLVAVIAIVGWMLPVKHRASRSMTVAAPPSAVFDLIADVRAYPTWRRGVSRVEVLNPPNSTAPFRFKEYQSRDAILYEVDERTPNQRMVSRIADPNLPFGGRWTYEIAPAPAGSTLRITEDGEVYNPIFRFMSRFVIGQTRTVDQYLRDVAARVGMSSVDIRG